MLALLEMPETCDREIDRGEPCKNKSNPCNYE
jgi:hypothetical protein